MEKKQWIDAATTFSRCLFEAFRCYDVDHGMSFLVLGVEHATNSQQITDPFFVPALANAL